MGGQTQRAERRYPWQPWKREPPLKWPLTGTITLKNSVEILTRENIYLPENYLIRNHQPPGRERGEGVRIRSDSPKGTIDPLRPASKATMQYNFSYKPPKRPCNSPKGRPDVTYCNRWQLQANLLEFNFAYITFSPIKYSWSLVESNTHSYQLIYLGHMVMVECKCPIQSISCCPFSHYPQVTLTWG